MAQRCQRDPVCPAWPGLCFADTCRIESNPPPLPSSPLGFPPLSLILPSNLPLLLPDCPLHSLDRALSGVGVGT